jgi:single-stranded-DNA-specific exonuclease
VNDAFDAICREQLDDAALERVLETDGELGDGELGLDTARALESAGPWGQGFPEPLFDGRFEIRETRIVGERHARYRMQALSGGPSFNAIHFGGAEQRLESGPAELAYRLVVNRYDGFESAELRVEMLRRP